MKTSDKRILLIVGGVVALVALWFAVISPKRSELGELDSQVAAKQAEVSEQEQAATLAQAAKGGYQSDYRELITLGKAVPADDDASSLIDQIDGLAEATGVEFLGLTLAASSGAAAAPETPPPPAPADAGGEAADGDGAASGEPASGGAASGEAAGTPTAAAATETAAADLPLGATVGPAGLPIMPYSLTFRGSFFEVADFLKALDNMVRTDPLGVAVDGRLLTVNSLDLHPDEAGSGELAVDMEVTSYVAPADQGATGGATPATPAPDAAAPAATPTTSGAPAPTAAVTP